MLRLFVLVLIAISLVGCEGPQGEHGVMGPQGPRGPQGEDGADGLSLIWLHRVPIAEDYCDILLDAPPIVTNAIRSGRALLTLELLVEGYWLPTPVVWWGGEDWPQWQSLLIVGDNGALRVINGCGFTIRIRVYAKDY
jgi:hypothetical protein